MEIYDRRVHGFIIVDNPVIDNPDLTPYDKTVYMVLCRHARTSDNKCWPSIATICHKANCSRSSVEKAIKRLKEYGLIGIEKRFREDGGSLSNVYEILPIANLSPTGVCETAGGGVCETATNNKQSITINNKQDNILCDSVTEQEEDMQNKLINLPEPEPIEKLEPTKKLSKRQASLQKLKLAFNSQDFTALTPTDLIFYFEQRHNQEMPFPINIPPGADLGYTVGRLKTGLLEPYNLSGRKAIQALDKFIRNYPKVAGPQYLERIDPIIFTMPGFVDRIMNYGSKLETKSQDKTGDVF